jgi:TrmH family RNA methyltransferase
MSAGPPTVESVLALRDRAVRDATGRFFVEGVRFVITADREGHAIDALVVAPDLLHSAVAEQLVARRRRTGTPVLDVDDAQFRALSILGEPQGIGAVVRQRWVPPSALRDPHHNALWIAAGAVRSPGNLGTLLRTADAVGADGLLCLSPVVDPHDPRVVRATMGALFAQHVCRVSPAQLREANRYGALFVVGATPDADLDYRALSYRRPIVLMIGSERDGLRADERALCDAVVRIPMRPHCDSLNLAVAASLVLYEAYGQRHPARRRR